MVRLVVTRKWRCCYCYVASRTFGSLLVVEDGESDVEGVIPIMSPCPTWASTLCVQECPTVFTCWTRQSISSGTPLKPLVASSAASWIAKQPGHYYPPTRRIRPRDRRYEYLKVLSTAIGRQASLASHASPNPWSHLTPLCRTYRSYQRARMHAASRLDAAVSWIPATRDGADPYRASLKRSAIAEKCPESKNMINMDLGLDDCVR